MTIQFTIIGLELVGASIGLALGSIKEQVTRVGNDKEWDTCRKAEKAGAVDKIITNLPQSVRDADAVILAVPVDEIRKTVEVIAADLKPGAVLIDTSVASSKAAEWASELLPGPDRYFVSMLPCLNPSALMETQTGPSAARADLFRNSVMLISCLPGTDQSALDLTANLAAALGSSVLISDSVEKDGVVASAVLLPQVLSAALVNAVTEQPGWNEARKLAGASFAMASAPLELFPERAELGKTAIDNGENTARMLGLLINELQELRDIIATKDAPALQERLNTARKSRSEWLQQRRQSAWIPASKQDSPGNEGFFGRLFGLRGKKETRK